MLTLKSHLKSLLLQRYCAAVAQYDHWGKEQHERWQLKRWKRLLIQAERHVPYYRRRFHEIGFRAQQVQNLRDIETLPFVTKEEIKRFGPHEFCDERVPRFLRVSNNTGGSSGTPCPLLGVRPFSWLWEQAFMIQQWRRIGYKPEDRVAVLRGRAVFDRDRIYEFRSFENRLLLSTYALNKQRLAEYIKAMNHFKVRYLHVYPSSLAVLIDCIRASPAKIRFSHLRGVFAGSERLLPGQKESCEELLGVPCYHWYGHSEGTLMGGWCESTDKFHFFPEYGYLELVGECGRNINTPDGMGELVGTGFCNPAMILIRYRTGDLGSGMRWEACGCGREFPTLDQIHGRTQEYVVTHEGSKIPVTALIFGLHLPIFNHYGKVQVEQAQPGSIVVRLENPGHIAHPAAIESSKTAMQAAVNGRLSITFEEVDAIPTLPNGKHRFVIQHVMPAVA